SKIRNPKSETETRSVSAFGFRILILQTGDLATIKHAIADDGAAAIAAPFVVSHDAHAASIGRERGQDNTRRAVKIPGRCHAPAPTKAGMEMAVDQPISPA